MRAMILSERAFAAMEEDCLTHEETETGGILVGKRMENRFIVPFVVLGGPSAFRSWGGFSPDPIWQQRYLDYLFDRFDVDYCGDYHRHPNRFDRPSGTDRKTARHIVTDPNWAVSEAVFPILTLDQGRVRMRGYRMHRGAKDFEEIPVTIAPDRDPRLQDVLLGLPTEKEKDHDTADSPDCTPGGHRGCRRLGRWLAYLRHRPRKGRTCASFER